MVGGRAGNRAARETKSERKDGTFSRSDFAYDLEADFYVCSGGKELPTPRRMFSSQRQTPTKAGTIIYRASNSIARLARSSPSAAGTLSFVDRTFRP
jgi:hypothetical protein